MLLAIIRLVGLVILFYLVYRLLTSVLGKSGGGGGGGGFGVFKRGPDYKCKTCLHCKKLFEDGALCQWGGRETFKNPTHIGNCMDYERK